MRYGFWRALTLSVVLASSCVTEPAIAAPLQPVSIFGGPLRPLGYCQITNLAASTAIVTASCSTGSVPQTYSVLDLSVEGNPIRYETNGGTPTATIGMPLASGGEKIFVLTNFSNLRLIQQAGGAIANLEFFGQ